MKITKIELQKKNNKRYSIYLDDEYSFGIHEDVLVKSGLYVGRVIDQEYIDDVIKKEEQSKANHYALNLISYRSRSKKEVLTKMTEKGYMLDIIEKTVQFLTDNSLLNDYEFSLMFIRDKTTLSRHSLTRVKHDLKQKGVSKETIQEAMYALEDDGVDPDFDNAKYLSLKKYNELKGKRKFSELSEYEIRQKVYQSIGQKGFNFYIIKDALEEALNEEDV